MTYQPPPIPRGSPPPLQAGYPSPPGDPGAGAAGYGYLPVPPPPAGPKRFSHFIAPLLAPLFVFGLYRDVGRNWRGIGFWYLVLVLVLTWLPVWITWHTQFARFVANDVPKIAAEVPPITIVDGVVSSPVEQPYEVRFPPEAGGDGPGDLFFVLDTTGQVNTLRDTEAMVLLTRDRLYTRDERKGEERSFDLSGIKQFNLDAKVVQGWADGTSRVLGWVGFPVSLLFSLAFRLVQGVIYAAIALVWNGVFNARLSFAALMRLAFIAITPVLLIDTVLLLIPATVPFWTLLGILLAQVYLFAAVMANRQDEFGPTGTIPPPPPPYAMTAR